MTKIEQWKKSKQAERKMHAAIAHWHLMKIAEAHESGNQHAIVRHELAIRNAELKMHQLKRHV